MILTPKQAEQAESLWDSVARGLGGSERLMQRLSRVALKGLEAEERGYEAMLQVYNDIGWTDPLEGLYNAGPQGQFLVAPPPPYFRQNYDYGEAIPYYITEQGLRYLRDISRIICSSSEYAISAMENRQSYIIGTGLRYQAESAGEEVDRSLLHRAQQLIDFFQEYNDLPSIESEAVRRMDEDGECFIRLFPFGNGVMKVRFVEPEHVTSTGISYPNLDPQHSFGIETRAGDIEDVLGYWIIANPLYAWTPEFVPVDQVIHLKTTTHRAVKRGLPLFYSVTRNLKRVEEVMGSLSAMARARAKIALIRKVKNGTPSAIASLASAITKTTLTDPTSGVATNVEDLQDGTILTSSGSIEYEMPNAQTGAGEFIEVIKQELKGIAARCVMPIWMFAADNGDMGAYTASLVAEAPSTKKFEREQQYICNRFGKARYGTATGLMWRYLQHAAKCGYFPEDSLYKIKIQVIAPPVATRNRFEEAQTNNIYHQMGAKPLALIQQENGWDSDVIKADLAKEKAQEATLQPTPAYAKQNPEVKKAAEGYMPEENQNPMRDKPDGQ